MGFDEGELLEGLVPREVGGGEVEVGFAGFELAMGRGGFVDEGDAVVLGAGGRRMGGRDRGGGKKGLDDFGMVPLLLLFVGSIVCRFILDFVVVSRSPVTNPLLFPLLLFPPVLQLDLLPHNLQTVLHDAPSDPLSWFPSHH